MLLVHGEHLAATHQIAGASQFGLVGAKVPNQPN